MNKRTDGGVRMIVPVAGGTSFFPCAAQSVPVAVAIIARTKSNYDQFRFARIRTNIKRFALKFGARCMGCVPISRVGNFVYSFRPASASGIFIIFFVVFHLVYDAFRFIGDLVLIYARNIGCCNFIYFRII